MAEKGVGVDAAADFVLQERRSRDFPMPALACFVAALRDVRKDALIWRDTSEGGGGG